MLVTGGAGFIGSAFVRAALASGVDRLTVLDKLTYAANPSSLEQPARDPRFELIEGDVCDPEACRQAFASGDPDWVVHLAAESHVDRSIDDPAPFLRTNVLGTGVVLDACLAFLPSLDEGRRDGFRLLHSSTDEVFGEIPARTLAVEDSPYAPSSPYSATKAASDHLVRSYGRTYGLPYLISHSGNNYGPRQFPEKLVPLALRQLGRGRAVPLYGDGEQVRDWIHVEDHCRALLAIGDRAAPGRSYCVGAGESLSNRELVATLVEALGLDPAGQWITPVPDRPGHDRRYALDPSRLAEEIGWRAELGLAEGLRRTAAWYQDHQDWTETALRRAGYDGERLGLGPGSGRSGR